MSENEQASESLLGFRRDAVACILMNLYVLAGALKGNRKVPVSSSRYLLLARSNPKIALPSIRSIGTKTSSRPHGSS
jgi:hypothetical protein